MRNRLVILALATASLAAYAGATITILNGDPDGQGFNDPTPVDPVGGNPGLTLGQQRLNAFQAAADKWGASLNSTVPIRVLATFESLSCTESSAALGFAGPAAYFSDFTNAPRTGVWFSKAQAGALAGQDMDPSQPDIRAKFNVDLGKPGCFTGTSFYLGLDANHGDNVDLVTILTHEFAHGLGFQTSTDGLTGAQAGGLPSAWDFFLLDTTTGKTWDQMTNTERSASALKAGKLVWNGSNVNKAASSVLKLGTPYLTVTQPNSVAGSYAIGLATFGPPLADPPVTGALATFVDTSAGQALACDPLSPDNAAAVAGNIALVDRGTCTFVLKTLNLQAAGAIGVIVADNVAGPPQALSGSDPAIQIPAVRITQANGVSLKAALAAAGTGSVMAALGVDPAQLQGADHDGNVLMYVADPFLSVVSVVHFDTSAFPNQLMEPFAANDLTHEVTPPFDLTLMLLRDIGWP